MAKVNQPPLRLPKTLAADPEISGFFNELTTVIRQLWVKAGLSIVLEDGTVDVPGIGFASEPGLGIYHQSDGVIGFAGAGDTLATLSATGLHVSNIPLASALYNTAAGLINGVQLANGQLLIGAAGAIPQAGVLTGTANRITVTNGPGTITFTAPQDIHAGASPTFANLTISGLTANSFAYSGTAGLLASAGAPTNGQLLIGQTGGPPLRAAPTGTANQVTVTLGAGTITFSLPQDIGTSSTPNFADLVGTATNDSAATGNIGEYLEATVASGSAVSLVNGIQKNVASISLTAGDWDVFGFCAFLAGATTTATAYAAEASLTSNTFDVEYALFAISAAAGNANQNFPFPGKRISLAATTTVYLVASANFAISTMGAYGRISARRAR